MNPPTLSRRSFLQASTALSVGALLLAPMLVAQTDAGGKEAPLIAYVGTFSSPLKNVRPTQVDLPPGNGRGIHLFKVDRRTGAMTACGVHEQGNSPSCLAFNAAGTRLYSSLLNPSSETIRTPAIVGINHPRIHWFFFEP